MTGESRVSVFRSRGYGVLKYIGPHTTRHHRRYLAKLSINALRHKLSKVLSGQEEDTVLANAIRIEAAKRGLL